MKILSLFDGMSVAQQALKEAGIPVKTYYASEIDKYAIATTQSNFPNTIQLGGVENIDRKNFMKWSSIENTQYEIDLLIGGSPCQDLSIAKKNREGLKGSRSGLFWEYVRIRDEVKPKYFILENVASMPKEAKEVISEALGVEPVMINASLVSAQNRKRLFWVGKWNGKKYEQVEIPQPEDKNIMLKDILEPKVEEGYYVKLKSNTIRTGGRGSGINDKHNWDTIRVAKIGKGGQGDRIYSQEGKSTALSANGGGRDAKTGLYYIPHGYIKEKVTQEEKYPTLHAQNPASNHLLVQPVALRNRGKGKKPEYNGTGKANAMTSVQTDSMVEENMQIRKLTPTECLRLQSMPDNYFDKAIYKNKPISNTQRYKMCGNAFNKEVIVHVLKHLK